MKHVPVTRSPQIMGGTPVFSGTRVPVETLFEYLQGGSSIEDFIDGFPTVTREQILAVLEDAKDHALAVAS